MTAHLATERRAGLAHLRLDQRMPGLPHQRHATALGDPWRQVAGALDVVQDLLARMARQHVGGEQHQLPVGVDYLAIAGDHAETVAVAVERQADFGITLGQAADQVLQVFRMRRIGMMIRKIAIDLAEQFGNLATHRAIQVAGKCAGHPVAAVNDDLHRPRQPDVAADAFEVGGADVMRAVAALAVSTFAVGIGELAAGDRIVQGGDRLAMDCFTGQHHLEAVVVGRIVAAGHHDARLRIQHVGTEVHHRRDDDAEVHHVHARRLQAVGERRRQGGAGQPPVAADHGAAFALGDDRRAEGQADLSGDGCIEGGADDATDIVSLENAGGKRHGGRFK